MSRCSEKKDTDPQTPAQVSVPTALVSSKMLRRAFVVSLGVMLVAPLTGCGRKSAPNKPKGSKYPRDYPSQ